METDPEPDTHACHFAEKSTTSSKLPYDAERQGILTGFCKGTLLAGIPMPACAPIAIRHDQHLQHIGERET